MKEYNFSFDSEESKQIFEQSVEASKAFEKTTDEFIERLFNSERESIEDVDKYLNKVGIVAYFDGEDLIHIKVCKDNPNLKFAGATSISYLEVEERFLADLLNTINLKLKPKFIINLNGRDKGTFLHLQKLSLIAEGLDVPDEDAVEFANKSDVSMYTTGSGVLYANLGEFIEKLIAFAK